MKKRVLFPIRLIAFNAIILLTLTGCPPCKDVQLPQNPLPFGEQVRLYIDRDQQKESEQTSEVKKVAYFDLSDGMECAYNATGIRSNLERIVHTVAANNDEWDNYGLVAGEVKSMGNMSQTELFNRIVNTRNTGIMAPIEEALKRIVKDKNPALLVTDFEEYTKDAGMNATVIQPEAYAARYFQDWMRTGGIIKFYIMDFAERQKNKKLFFVVFDNNEEKLIDDINHAMKLSNQNNIVEYVLNPRPYKVFTDYPFGKGGNFFAPQGDPLGFDFMAFEGRNLETYHIKRASWLKSIEILMNYRNNPKMGYTDLLSKLYVDLSDTQSRNIEKLGLNVTDITADFNSFTNHEFAKTYEPVKGEDGTCELDCEQRFFYNELGQLLPAYEYTRQDPVEIMDNFLVIDQQRFEDSRRVHPERTEIAIDFDRMYTDSTMFKDMDGEYVYSKREQKKNELNGRILKVDVCIVESGFNDYSQLEDLFNFESILNYKDGNKIKRNKGINRCISQSIIETLRKGDLDPKGRVIYTFIMKDTPQFDYSE